MKTVLGINCQSKESKEEEEMEALSKGGFVVSGPEHSGGPEACIRWKELELWGIWGATCQLTEAGHIKWSR